MCCFGLYLGHRFFDSRQPLDCWLCPGSYHYSLFSMVNRDKYLRVIYIYSLGCLEWALSISLFSLDLYFFSLCCYAKKMMPSNWNYISWAMTVLWQQMILLVFQYRYNHKLGHQVNTCLFYLSFLDLCPVWLIVSLCTDMPIFGQCPAQDDFYLVMCSHCGQVVKPQAFQAHYGKCHAHAYTYRNMH